MNTKNEEKEKTTLQEDLKKLQEISHYFENEESVDIEEGLKKVEEGARLAKKLKLRLKAVENKFETLTKDLNKE
jgi:exodeoxyribonuclease VII small subunit